MKFTVTRTSFVVVLGILCKCQITSQVKSLPPPYYTYNIPTKVGDNYLSINEIIQNIQYVESEDCQGSLYMTSLGYGNTLHKFDITDNGVIYDRTIHFEKEGPYGIGQSGHNGVYVWNKDTLIVKTFGSLNIMNSSGDIIKVLSCCNNIVQDGFVGFPWIFSGLTGYKFGRKIIFSTSGESIIKHAGIELDMDTQELGVIIPYDSYVPGWMGSANGGHFHQYFCADEENVYFTNTFLPYIYKLDVEYNEIARIDASSSFVSRKIKPLSKKIKDFPPEVEERNMKGQGVYLDFMYDPYNRLFYRSSIGRQKLYESKERSWPGDYLFLSVFDENLILIGEYKIEKPYTETNSIGSFISPAGYCILNENMLAENEDIISFDCFQFR